MLALKYTKQFRILSPNEAYYKAYDDAKQWAELQYKDDMDDYDDEE
jgi:hypothetical protein